MTKNMKHKEIIKNVMEKMLFGSDELVGELKEQYKDLKIVSVEDTGVGFYVDFETENNTVKALDEKVFLQKFQIGDVYGNVEGIIDAVGFILFVKDGFITMLEAYTNGIDSWPDDKDIELIYDSGKERNIEELKKRIMK